MSDRSTIQSIALDRLLAHPDNPNRMSSGNFAKLVRNIEQTGRYEPLIVRPYRDKPRRSKRGKAEPRFCERTKPSAPSNDNENRASRKENRGRFQIINGYHRWQALRQLGYKRADVIVWDVDDEQADILLATLNRLVGCDELSRKISLLKKLSKKMNARELSKLIPQTPGQIKRLVNLRIPKAPAKIPLDKRAKPSLAGFANPLVFFVSDEQKKVIEDALFLAGQAKSVALSKGVVTPAKAGAQKPFDQVDSCLRRNDKGIVKDIRGGNDKPGPIRSGANSRPTRAATNAVALAGIARHFLDTTTQDDTPNED